EAPSTGPHRAHSVHYTGRERPPQPEGMTKRHDEGADPQAVGVGEGCRCHPAPWNAEERHVGAAIGDNELSLDLPIVRESDTDARCTGDMGVRHDEIGRPEDTRADTASAGTPDLDRHLPELIGDLREV